MQKHTNIKINGVDTEVIIHYYHRFGELVIVTIQDMDGNGICPDLLDEMSESDITDMMDKLKPGKLLAA